MKWLSICCICLCYLFSGSSAKLTFTPGLSNSGLDSLPTIKVYNSFEAMAPIFNYKNDTIYVINFWATWCQPCVEEIPYFEQLPAAFPNKAIKVILVSLDFPNQIKNRVIPFIQKHQLKSEVILLADPDQNGWIPKVNEDWSGIIPVTLSYNKEKNTFREGQFKDLEDLKHFLKALL